MEILSEDVTRHNFTKLACSRVDDKNKDAKRTLVRIVHAIATNLCMFSRPFSCKKLETPAYVSMLKFEQLHNSVIIHSLKGYLQ